jgi:PilZ domain
MVTRSGGLSQRIPFAILPRAGREPGLAKRSPCEPLQVLRPALIPAVRFLKLALADGNLAVSMDAGLSRARDARAQPRHELRTLTYVTLDQGNGGIVRNLTSGGMRLQVIAPVSPLEQYSVRLDLRNPRLRIETRGEVVWSALSGECGIRFLDLSPRTTDQIKEWILADQPESVTIPPGPLEPVFFEPIVGSPTEEAGCTENPESGETDDGLLISATGRSAIELPTRPEPMAEPVLLHREVVDSPEETTVPLDWLSAPLSGRGLAWTVNVLIVVAGLLLFVVVFLSFVGEAPPWPLAVIAGMAGVVTLMYWGFFQLFGGSSFGTRLARLVTSDPDQKETISVRFR